MKAPQLERIIPTPESSFKAYYYREEKFNSPWHFHPECELVYIDSSKGMRYVGTSVEHFETGDLVLLGPNVPHCWKNTEPNHCPATSIVIQWEKNFLGAQWFANNEFLSIKQMIEHAERGIKFNHREFPMIRSNLKGLLTASPFNKLIQFISVLHQLANASNTTFLSGEKVTHSLTHEDNDRINKVCSYVEENYDQHLTLEKAASLSAMSEEAFCRFFSKNMGKSFFTFANEYKVNLVCQQLIHTDQQIAQTAYECGYNSLPYFYRQFKKFKDCTPSSYRKKYQHTLSG